MSAPKPRILSDEERLRLHNVEKLYQQYRRLRRLLVLQAITDGASYSEVEEASGINRGNIHNIVKGRKR